MLLAWVKGLDPKAWSTRSTRSTFSIVSFQSLDGFTVSGASWTIDSDPQKHIDHQKREHNFHQFPISISRATAG